MTCTFFFMPLENQFQIHVDEQRIEHHGQLRLQQNDTKLTSSGETTETTYTVLAAKVSYYLAFAEDRPSFKMQRFLFLRGQDGDWLDLFT